MKVEAFIIHLKRATARRRQVDALVAELPIPANVCDAVDGLTIPDETLAQFYKPSVHAPPYPFGLRKSEIACFLSHRLAWQQIVDKDLDFGLVLEDDVRIEAGFSAALDLAIKSAQPGDYVRFPRWVRSERGPVTAEQDGASIIAPHLPGLGMQAELIGRDAAARLLEFTQVFDRPVDTTIQMNWLHPVRILSVRPIVITEIAHLIGGSVIQNKLKSKREVLSRELNRLIYRGKVRLAGLGWR